MLGLAWGAYLLFLAAYALGLIIAIIMDNAKEARKWRL